MRICVLVLTLCAFTSAQRRPRGPLTSDFLDWLVANGYESENFDRPDVGPNGSFGGRTRRNEPITHEPVIFVHGNADAALYTQTPIATGWSRSIQYFLEQNYTSAELYATTWGDAWAV
uniref:Lipase n=1 Tax=Parascaris univalens TaxID=6257 RepID=A0A915BZR3_PARUN